ncbi:MAG: hypothetical protein QXE31_00360 [Candidatus Woesearchaeota archaeon]
MSWKQIAKSNDLIIFEKNLKNYKIKIEARKTNDYWEIFKTKIKGESSTLISQYKVSNNELNDILKKLKKNKQEVNEEINFRPEKIFISLKRIFKEEFTEKWEFKILNEDKNFILLHFEDALEVDIVLNKKYKPYENQILNQLRDNLGLEEFSSNIYTRVYYFETTSYYSEENDFFTVDEDFLN